METILSRFEPPAKLDDEFYQLECELSTSGITKFMPCAKTARLTYIPNLDRRVTQAVDAIFKAEAGNCVRACVRA